MPVFDYSRALFDFERAVSNKLGREPVISRPFEADGEIAQVRARLVEEEAAELVEALRNGTLEEVAKEVADLLYVTFGTALAFGLPIETIFLRVHLNNMEKMAGATWDGQKLLKPKKHPKPVLGDLIKDPRQMDIEEVVGG